MVNLMVKDWFGHIGIKSKTERENQAFLEAIAVATKSISPGDYGVVAFTPRMSVVYSMLLEKGYVEDRSHEESNAYRLTEAGAQYLDHLQSKTFKKWCSRHASNSRNYFLTWIGGRNSDQRMVLEFLEEHEDVLVGEIRHIDRRLRHYLEECIKRGYLNNEQNTNEFIITEKGALERQKLRETTPAYWLARGISQHAINFVFTIIGIAIGYALSWWFPIGTN